MKRIALIADLHGNLPAVEALEQDLKTRSVDEIWCLGDIVGKGPSSPDTFDWAMAHCSLILRGNWDEGVASLISPAIIALTLGSVLLTGIVLTLVCAFFSVNRHLYMSREEANLY